MDNYSKNSSCNAPNLQTKKKKKNWNTEIGVPKVKKIVTITTY